MQQDNATNQAILARIEDLEIRITHQDATLDELTRVLLEQEKIIKLQARKIKQLEGEVKALAPPSNNTSDNEIPPHY